MSKYYNEKGDLMLKNIDDIKDIDIKDIIDNIETDGEEVEYEERTIDIAKIICYKVSLERLLKFIDLRIETSKRILNDFKDSIKYSPNYNKYLSMLNFKEHFTVDFIKELRNFADSVKLNDFVIPIYNKSFIENDDIIITDDSNRFMMGNKSYKAISIETLLLTKAKYKADLYKVVDSKIILRDKNTNLSDAELKADIIKLYNYYYNKCLGINSKTL